MSENELIEFFRNVFKENNMLEKYKISLPSMIHIMGHDEKERFKNYASFSFVKGYGTYVQIINYRRHIRNDVSFFEILKNSYRDSIPIKIELFCYWGNVSHYTVRYGDKGCYVENTKTLRLNQTEKAAIKVIQLMDSI